MVGRSTPAEEVLELRNLDPGARPRSALEAGVAGLGEDGVVDEDEGLLKRQSAVQIYISANTCVQPQPNSSTSSLQAPQLTLYISTATQNTCPGPGQDAGSQIAIPFTEGAVTYNASASSDVYLSVAAANLTSDVTPIVIGKPFLLHEPGDPGDQTGFRRFRLHIL